MEEKAEAEYLMRELIKRMKTQTAVAGKLGQSKQAFNKSLHHGPSVPLKRMVAMRELLNQLIAEETQTACIPVPITDAARLKLALLTSEKKDMLAHFKAIQSILLPNYATAAAFELPLKMINTAIYYYPPLLEAEKTTHLPLRTTFIGLLACCDSNGYFY